MDKQRRPNVVRTWTVERTKVRYPAPPPAKPRLRSQKELFQTGGDPIHLLRSPKGGQ
jgi:hypothetical protein